MRSLLNSTAVYFLGNLLNRLGAFILLPIYTSYLTVGQYGALEIIFSTNAILGVVMGAGLAHSTLRFYFDVEGDHARGKVIITNLVIGSLLAAAVSLALVPFAPELAQWLFEAPLVEYIYLALLIVSIELGNEIFFAFLRAKDKPWLYVLLSCIKLLVQLGLCIYLVRYLGRGVEGVLLANLAAVASAWLVLLAYVLRHCGFGLDLALVRPVLAYSVPVAAAGLVGTVLSNVDRYLIKEFVGIEDVGVYGLAMKFALLLMFLVQEPFTRSYGPYRFAVMQTQGAQQVYALAAKAVMIIGCWVGLGVALVSPVVIHYMSADAFHRASILIPILAAGVVAGTLNYCFQTAILIKKQTGAVFRITLFSSLLSLALNLILIPRLGVIGAAFSFAAGQWVMALVTLWVAQRLIHVPYNVPYYLGVLVFSALLYAPVFYYLEDIFLYLGLVVLVGLCYPLVLSILDKQILNYLLRMWRERHSREAA